MTKTLIIVFLAVVIIILCFIGIFRDTSHTKRRHKAKMSRAEKLYEKFNTDPDITMGRFLAYLRKIDPYVFEELVLLAFEKRGFRVYRNKRYSGDGGIDGRIERNGVIYLLQMKRYRSYVDNKHLTEFSDKCMRRHSPGFFVHTGKTGKKSKDVVRNRGNMRVISGERLLCLIVPSQGELDI